MKTLLVVALLVHVTYAEPLNLHLSSDSHVVTSGGSVLDLPPGHFLDDTSYVKLDAEVKRLQDTETRLQAENKSLRASLDSWQPGPYTLAGTFLVGLATGVYLWSRL